MVGDGHAMGIAAQVVEHMLWAAEWAFGRPPSPFEQRSSHEENVFGSAGRQISMESQSAVTKGALESRNKLATKDTTEHLDGKKEGVASFDPAGVISRESAGRDHAMDMRVKFELLIPTVQYAEEADLCAEMFGITSDFEKGFRTGAEQEIVDDPPILQGQWCQLSPQRRQRRISSSSNFGLSNTSRSLRPLPPWTWMTMR